MDALFWSFKLFHEILCDLFIVMWFLILCFFILFFLCPLAPNPLFTMLIMPRIRMHDRRVSIGKWGGKPSFWPSITTSYRWIWHFGNIKSAKTPRQYILINAEMQRCGGKLEIWICVDFVGNNKEMFERGGTTNVYLFCPIMQQIGNI